MPSLSQILRDHAPLLLLDAASARVQVGHFPKAGEPRWQASSEEAGVALFEAVGALGIDLAEVRAFAFCEGPGSILGIRTAAMAIRAWTALQPRPVFSYQSLALVAEANPGVTAIADARRGLWHRQVRGRPLDRVPAAELSGNLAIPEGFRSWETPPPSARTLPYDLATILAVPFVAEADLFSPTASPDAFLHQEPDYVKWVPQIHRAP